MSNSLTVHKLDNICSELKEGKDIILNAQKSLVDFDVEIPECFLPKTEIKYQYSDASYIYYHVKSSSNLIKEKIYVYWDEFENFTEYTKGYSPISEFKLLIDINFKNVYIFASKKVAERFLKHLTKEKKASCSNVSFDFSRILELQKLVGAWGIWEDSRGAVTKTARFGKDVIPELSNDEFSSITTMYIDYIFENDTVQLVLNAEGRIATQNNLNNSDMLFIYNDIARALVKNNCATPTDTLPFKMNKQSRFTSFF